MTPDGIANSDGTSQGDSTPQSTSASGAKGVHPQEMHGHAPKSSNDFWVFNAEAVSTLLIAAWYIFGVFIALKIIPENGFHRWGATWVIPFLLGIFYLGAGYLFQRFQKVTSFSQWGTYMKREVIVLLTPFFAFTILTLLTASLVSLQPELIRSGVVEASPVFSGKDLLHAIFVHPVGPVGYFIILLGFFVIARTPQTRKGMVALLLVSFAVKVAAMICADLGLSANIPYYLIGMMDNWIWFVLGIALRFFNGEPVVARRKVAALAAVGFIGVGAVLFVSGTTEAFCLSVLTFLGLLCFYSVSAAHFMNGKQDRFFGFVTQYTMAIWLMHEILAQVVFCLLFALGVAPDGVLALDGGWAIVCAIACLVACYVLPVLVMTALSHTWKLGFIVYPSRYIPAAK